MTVREAIGQLMQLPEAEKDRPLTFWIADGQGNGYLFEVSSFERPDTVYNYVSISLRRQDSGQLIIIT